MTKSFERRDVFSEFMTKAIEKNLPSPGLSPPARLEVKKVFYHGYDKIIYDHFLKFNNHTLTSPAFDKRGFDKMFRKLFPDVDECDDRPAATLISFESLKQYADERISSMFCKTFFDVTKLTSQGMKNVISRGALESLVAAYLRIEILKYVMGVLPLLPVFNLKNVMKSDIFLQNIIESVEAMKSTFPTTYEILLDNCYEIVRFSIRGGGGESNNIANHNHVYEIDENGNGWLKYAAHPDNPKVRHAHRIRNYKVLQAQSPCYPNCKDEYSVDGVGPHAHNLEEKHTLPTRREAFVKILKEQMDIVLPIANSYFSSSMLRFKNVKRINDREDFFKAFIYPTYDPNINFTGPFTYGAREVEFETFEGQTGDLIYAMFEDEVGEAFEEFVEAGEFGLDDYMYTEAEYGMYKAATKLGTQYLNGKLVSTLNLYDVEKLEAAPEGYYNTELNEMTPGRKLPFEPLGVDTDGGYAYYISSYPNNMGVTFPTDPRVTNNGSGFYSEDNEAPPFISHFGLFAVEPYMFVDQKELLETASGWGEPEGLDAAVGTLIQEAGYFMRFVENQASALPYQGELDVINAAKGPISTRQSEIDSSRSESVISRLTKFIASIMTSQGEMANLSSAFNPQDNIFDDQGKSSIKLWGDVFCRNLPAIVTKIKEFNYIFETGEFDWNPDAESGIVNSFAFLESTLSQYFNNFCYGMRMVFHITDPGIVDNLTNILASEFGSNSDALATFMLENKVFGQEERRVAFNDDFLDPSVIEQLEVNYNNPYGAVYTVVTTQHKRFTIELFDTKMPIHHAYKCNPKYKELGYLGKNDIKAMGGLKIKNIMEETQDPDAIGLPIEIFNNHVVPIFHERLMNSDEYKLLFEHIFDYEHYLAAYTQFILAGNRQVNVNSTFKASQKIIANFLTNITSGKYSPDELSDLNNFHQRTSIASTQGIDIGEMMAALVLQTPFLILKGLVEIGDPCISVASKIQGAVRGIVLRILGAAKSAIAISQAAIAAAEGAMQQAQSDIAILDMEISQAENDLTELGFTQTVNEDGEIDYLFPTWGGDYEEMGEGDVTAWLSEEQAETAWAEAYDSWASRKEQRVAALNLIAEKQQEKNSAQEFLNNAGEIANKIEGFYEAADPYLLPIIALGLLPSDKYGAGIPIIGVGPPLTPFGLAHLIFTAAGINFDDLDASIRELIEQTLEDGNEEENCNV